MYWDYVCRDTVSWQWQNKQNSDLVWGQTVNKYINKKIIIGYGKCDAESKHSAVTETNSSS